MVNQILAPIDFKPSTPQLFHPRGAQHPVDPLHYLIEHGYTQ
jgi:hypothetical protein